MTHSFGMNYPFHYKLFWILFISFSFYTSSLDIPASSQWEVRYVPHRGSKLKLITLKHISTPSMEKILELIDKSSESLDPSTVKDNYSGLFRENDILCLNEKLLFWFSSTEKSERSVRSGGGLLSGMWEMVINNNIAEPKLKHNEHFYFPNILLPGSSPEMKLFGADIYGGYSDKKIVWGLENAVSVKEGPKMGKVINDRGPFTPEGGIFIQYAGILSNSGKLEIGFDSQTDTDPRPGIVGQTSYELTYRIPVSRLEIIQEIRLKAIENNFGPISTAFMALYLPGYSGKIMSWVSNPELMQKSEELSMKKAEVNKYFTNTGVNDLFFYNIPSVVHPKMKYSAHTPEGKGRVLCLGSPVYFIPFLCGYPTNDFIPKEAYDEYVLELSDNQTIEKYGKFHSINYKLLNSQGKSLTLSQGEEFAMIMRYKIIDASKAEDAEKEREKTKR